MMKRPSLSRERKMERNSSGAEPNELERGLSDAVARSIAKISEKVDAVIKEKYIKLGDVSLRKPNHKGYAE